MSTLSPEIDVRSARQGDREAFARLVTDTRSLVSSIALAIVRDVEASEDVAQEVYLAVWHGLSRLREPASFLPWLRALTRNRANQELRWRVRLRRRFAGADHDRLEAVADPAPDAGSAVLAAEERRLVADAIAALPDDVREIVTLYYREGRSTVQVAALLGIGEPAVRKRLERARTRLRHDLLERAGAAIERSAPGAGFTATLLAALAVGAPGTAAAATATAAVTGAGAGTAAAQAGGTKLAAKALLLGSGALLGAVGGLAGVFLGVARVKRQARDDQERRALDHFAWASGAVVVIACAAFPLGAALTGSPWAPAVTFAAFLGSLALLHALWLPRIVRRRREAELREDPERARALHRRERRLAILGWTLGTLSGSTGVALGIWFHLNR